MSNNVSNPHSVRELSAMMQLGRATLFESKPCMICMNPTNRALAFKYTGELTLRWVPFCNFCFCAIQQLPAENEMGIPRLEPEKLIIK